MDGGYGATLRAGPRPFWGAGGLHQGVTTLAVALLEQHLPKIVAQEGKRLHGAAILVPLPGGGCRAPGSRWGRRRLRVALDAEEQPRVHQSKCLQLPFQAAITRAESQSISI